MVTYVVQLDWPAERTPHLDAQLLLKHLADFEPVVAAGNIRADRDGTPWTVEVCVEGRTPRQAAQNALATVEPVVGMRVTGFRVRDSSRCEQLADLRDAVPDLIGEAELCHLLSISGDHGARLVREPGFPPMVVHTAHGELWDLGEVQDWLDATPN
ncbi:hypothetical protein [Nocardioides sp. CFH 31398]|uniref:hypothetical protein n=1 Tax=Nocardioides sp. CFH 31398 TaxID=2919579 RepID=UPI001F05D345|nr:hypothetical protein [Nocardioides sp. CFH 31398]MCH1867730.1 hypothetical protein [Nocardioides sp. CFH 31398]